MLHITNGDAVAGTLREVNLGGEVLAYDDVLHEGPTPAGLPPDPWRQVRARFHSECDWGTMEGCLHRLEAKDQILESAGTHDDVILWFEHDLFDQLILIQLLHHFSQQELHRTKLQLICIGTFPGFEKFDGLGQLNVEQLGSLFGTQKEVTKDMLKLGRAAWEAFCSTDPTEIEAILRDGTNPLPFLEGALVRHLQQFPSLRNGLSRTEKQVLQTLASAPCTPVDLFVADSRLEERVFMGDATFWLYLRKLSTTGNPLIQREKGGSFAIPDECKSYEEFRTQALAITPLGKAVLNGEQDCIRLNGIDRWLGGVHLQGNEAAWRWDEQKAMIVHS